jgi:ATP-dependent exoDNAse (exonuclease V) beta subunit
LHLGQQINFLQVRTLDSFFHQSVKANGLDLGLPTKWGIAEEHQNNELCANVLAQTCDDRGLDKMMDVVNGLHGEKALRQPLEKLQELVSHGLEIFQDAPAEAWQCVAEQPGPSQQTCLDLFQQAAIPQKKSGGDDSRWSKLKALLIDTLSGSTSDAFSLVEHTVVLKFASSGTREKYYNHSLEIWASELGHLVSYLRGLVSKSVAAKNKESFQLLRDYDKALLESRARSGLYGFQDISALLGRAVASGTISITPPQHLLLDEFQDTAVPQWRVLEPLLHDVLQKDGKLFCVGDVKQAIYGWRSGESKLLSGLPGWAKNTAKKTVTTTPKNTNYRSSQIILSTVDQVFQGVKRATFSDDDRSEACLAGPAERAALATWMSGYKKHKAHHNKLQGAAVLALVESHDTDELKEKDAVLIAAADRAAAILDDNPHASIAILCRTNKPIPVLQDRLSKHGIASSGVGGSLLTDSTVVRLFLSLCRWLDHKGNSLAAFAVQSSPLAKALNVSLGIHDSKLRTHLAYLRETILAEGMGPFLNGFAEATHKNWHSHHERRRFRQLIDLAFRWDAMPPDSVSAFADFVDSKRLSDPEAASVEVLTVHASKGLEYDVVILPQLKESLLKTGSNSLMGVRPDPYSSYDLVSWRPSGAQVTLLPKLHEMALTVDTHAVRDSLSLLYVAMTRAVHWVEMLLPPPPKKRGKDTYANMLRGALIGNPKNKRDFVIAPKEIAGLDAGYAFELLWAHPNSQSTFEPKAADKKVIRALPTADFARPLFSEVIQPRSLRTWSPSSAEGGGQIELGFLLAENGRQAKQKGTLVHALFEQIKWLEDGLPNDETLLAKLPEICQFIPSPNEAQEALAVFHRGLARAEIHAALTQPEQPTTVWPEKKFSLPVFDDDGNKTILRGTIDRAVLFLKDNGDIERIVIQDWKTGERADERYAPQLEAYRKAVMIMTGLPSEAIETELLYLEAD